MFYLMALLGFAFVIIIHELGHFVFAKWAGVRVDRFSVGMGPIIWSKTIGETEYALSLLPLGGYVKMLGQEDVPGRNPDDISERSYLAKSAPWKAAILFGGVLFNLVSSWIILVILAWYGAPVIQPVVGSVDKESQGPDGTMYETPAWVMGLRSGDRILSVNGEPIRGFQDVMMAGLADADAPVVMRVERDGRELELPADPTTAIAPVPNKRQGRPVLGVNYPEGRRIIHVVRAPGVEPAAGDPQPQERILACVDTGQDFSGWTGQMVDEHLLSFVGREVTLHLGDGSGSERDVRFRYAGNDLQRGIQAGLGLPVVLSSVLPDRPAAQAGLRPGDVVSAIDGEVVAGVSHFQSLIRRAVVDQRGLEISYLRRGDDGHWVGGSATVEATMDERLGRVLIGVGLGTVDAGVMPVLPPALGHDVSPLAASGIAVGDGIISLQPSGDAQVRALVLPQPEQRTIAIGEALFPKLLHTPSQGLLGRLGSKFFGLPAPRSVFDQIVGSRVERIDTTVPELVLRGIDPESGEPTSPRIVPLHRLPVDLQTALLGLRPGDWVCETISGSTAAGEAALIVVRAADTAADVQPRWVEVSFADPGLILRMMVEMSPHQLGHWTEAFTYANDNAVNMVVMTLKLIPRFFAPAEAGGIDASKSLQGPIGIFNELSARLEYMGFASFLHLVALIGLNLFLINLLPIPIVDGGQLLFLGIECIIRRPVPIKIQEALNWAGLALIIFLMLFVIGNDIARL